MRKITPPAGKAILSAMLFCISFLPLKTNAWGPEGHAIVGRLAMRFVHDDVRKNILALLGNMSIDTAANWMDIMKSNPDYDFMRSWHYIDYAKEKVYQPFNDDNIINRLLISFNELNHKNTLCTEQIRTDLLILLHLMGDLHMPLHTGYDDDLGGNKVIVQYDTLKTHNLHRFWDEDIIRLTNITEEGVLRSFGNSTDSLSKIDFVRWMHDSRSLLPQVYDFPDFTLSEAYLQKNKLVVERQLFLAGLRLATLLNSLFKDPAPTLNFKALTAKYKNGIDINEAKNYIGKTVTVCANVYNIRSTDKITQISLGERGAAPALTVIIFGSSYSNFTIPPAELYKDKNICVKGKVSEYQGKMQIVVEKPGEVEVL